MLQLHLLADVTFQHPPPQMRWTACLGVRRSQDHDATLSIKTEFMQHWDGLLTDTDVRHRFGCMLAEGRKDKYLQYLPHIRAGESCTTHLTLMMLSLPVPCCRPAWWCWAPPTGERSSTTQYCGDSQCR